MCLETVWTEEMSLLTTKRFPMIKDIFQSIDQRYAKNFPDSVAAQMITVKGRQRLDRPQV